VQWQHPWTPPPPPQPTPPCDEGDDVRLAVKSAGCGRKKRLSYLKNKIKCCCCYCYPTSIWHSGDNIGALTRQIHIICRPLNTQRINVTLPSPPVSAVFWNPVQWAPRRLPGDQIRTPCYIPPSPPKNKTPWRVRKWHHSVSARKKWKEKGGFFLRPGNTVFTPFPREGGLETAAGIVGVTGTGLPVSVGRQLEEARDGYTGLSQKIRIFW